MWAALKAAREDSSSGGRMYWLRKLIQSRMTGDDVNSHLDELGIYAEKLNALITTKNPLTANDVFSTSILISLPSEWLNCVSAMMNKEQVPSSWVIAALKAESLRQKSCKDQLDPVSVAKAEVATATEDKSKLVCSFCNRNGHNLSMCSNAARILKEAKAKRQEEFQSCQGGDSSSEPKTTQKKKSNPPQAAHAQVVELNDFLGDDDKSGLNESTYKVSRAAVTPLSARISSTKNSDFNLDLGCSISMTPYISSVNEVKSNVVPICLAANTVVNSTHSGRVPMPLDGTTLVKTLAVPSLHKPLMSIAGMCEKDLTVCFNKTACRIFDSSSLTMHDTEVGAGYRQGNLLYLPSELNVRFPLLLSAVSVLFAAVNSSRNSALLGYHQIFSHIGLKPLKALLKQLDI